MGIGELELGKLIGSEAEDFCFFRGEFDGLREMDIGDVGGKRGFDRMIGGVAQFSGKRERGGFVGRVELGVGKGMAESDGAAGGQKDFAPHAGIFIGRRGIPVHPGEAEIIFFRGEDFDGQRVLPVFVEELADLEFVEAIGSGNIVAIG